MRVSYPTAFSGLAPKAGFHVEHPSTQYRHYCGYSPKRRCQGIASSYAVAVVVLNCVLHDCMGMAIKKTVNVQDRGMTITDKGALLSLCELVEFVPNEVHASIIKAKGDAQLKAAGDKLALDNDCHPLRTELVNEVSNNVMELVKDQILSWDAEMARRNLLLKGELGQFTDHIEKSLTLLSSRIDGLDASCALLQDSGSQAKDAFCTLRDDMHGSICKMEAALGKVQSDCKDDLCMV